MVIWPECHISHVCQMIIIRMIMRWQTSRHLPYGWGKPLVWDRLWDQSSLQMGSLTSKWARYDGGNTNHSRREKLKVSTLLGLEPGTYEWSSRNLEIIRHFISIICFNSPKVPERWEVPSGLILSERKHLPAPPSGREWATSYTANLGGDRMSPG